MAEYIEREALKSAIYADGNLTAYLDYIINRVPAADVVSRDCFDRVLAENDAMRAQLAKIGKKPGDSMNDVRLAVYTVKEALDKYGVDVTSLWETATAQKAALDAAYVRGKRDADEKLKRKIQRMKSDASWDEDIRRGQVQGMW